MTQPLANPVGRLDVMVLRLAERCISRALPAHVSGQLWDVARPVIEREIKRLGIPARPVGVQDVVKLLDGPKRRRRCTG